MESEVNKAKNLTEEEFRSCYPQISIQPSPKLAVKGQPVKPSPAKAQAVAQKTPAQASPAPVKAANVSKVITQNVVTGQKAGKAALPVTPKTISVTKTLVASKTSVNTKTHVLTRGQVPASPGAVKQPAVTRTPVAAKSPQVMTKTQIQVLNKTVPTASPAANKTPVVMRVQAVPQVKATAQSPGLKQLTLTGKSPQAPALVKTQANVAVKPVNNTTPKVAQKVTVPVTTGKEATPNQPASNLKVVASNTPKPVIQRTTSQLTQSVVLSSNNQVVLQPVVSGGMLIQTKNISAGNTIQGNKIVVGSAQSTSQAAPQERPQALQVSKQVTLFGPKGNTLSMEDFKKEQNLKQSAMTNVVSSTTNPTPAPAPVPAPTQAEQKKTQPPQRNLPSSESPVRQSPRGTANVRATKAKAVPVKQYQSTLGQVKKVSPRQDVLPQSMSPAPQDMQLANEEEVTTSEIEETSDNPELKLILILPTGEKKSVSLPSESTSYDLTLQDILHQYSDGEGRDSVNIVSFTGEANDLENISEQWDIAEREDQDQVMGLEPGEIPNLSEIEKEDGAEEGLKDSVADSVLHEGLLAVCKSCGYTSEDFNFCQRCKKKLPEDCKTVPANELHGPAENQKTRKTKADSLTGGSPKKKRVCRKRKVDEPVCLTISDEEGELLGLMHNSEMSDENCHSDSSQMYSNDKEPVITDEMMNELNQAKSGKETIDKELEELLDSAPPEEQTFLQCRTVRIGSYKVVPKDRVLITPHGIKIVVPVLGSDQSVDIKILFNEIVKVLIAFGRQLPVLFFYTKPIADIRIRRLLRMEDKKGYYYDTTSSDETHRRITLLPEKMDESCKQTLKNIFSRDPSQRKFAELTGKEANDILVKTSPKEVQEFLIKKKQPNKTKPPPPPPPLQQFNGQDIHTIMVYPPPPVKGGIPINTEDYACLGEDQFLNDVIIDFYLKYVVEQMLEPADRARTHVFSSFFYNRLTTKPGRRKSMNATESDPTASPAVKRHSRVKSWTKNVDLFTKDFVVIPINENSHWFLAIVCFPGLTGPVRFSDNTPIDLPNKKKKNSNAAGNNTGVGNLSGKQTVTIGSTTITAVTASTLDVQDEGDRDEADGEDENMDVPDEEEDQKTPEVKEELEDDQVPMATRSKKQPREPIKQPCILIFDSLAGASRARVVATLRDYLRVEYETKHNDVRDFSGDVLKGTNVKCPQQTNYTDCGLYVLQYVEAFFQTPITDFHIPIQQVQNWFTPAVVDRKRYEIQQLLHKLMEEQNLDLATLNLPVLNLRPECKLVDYEENEDEEEEMCDEEEDLMLDEEEDYHEGLDHEEMGEMEEGDMDDMGDGDMEGEMEDGEMEDGEYDDEEGTYLETGMDHEEELDDEYVDGEDMDDMGMEEDGEVMHEEFSVSEENNSLRPSSSGKSDGLKTFRIPRLTKKDNVNSDDL